jgi:hypothetical protein
MPAEQTPQPPRSRKKLMIWIVAAIVVLLLAGGAAWYVIHRTKHTVASKTPTRTTTKTITKKPTEKLDPLLAKFTTPVTNEKWTAPVQVGNLGYYADDTDGSLTTYYQIGNRGQNIIYMGSPNTLDEERILFEKAPDGTVHAILQPNANATYDSDYNSDTKSQLADIVVADTTIHYDSLSLPKNFSVGNGETVAPKGAQYPGLGSLIQSNTDTTVTRTVVHTYGGSKLVKIERKYADTHLTAVSYAVDLPIGTELALNYAPIATDLTNYTWNNDSNIIADADSAEALMGGIVRGCGSAAFAVSRADAVTDADFVAAGKTEGGKTVYMFKDTNNAIVQKAYSEYADYYADDSPNDVVSFNDFLKQHAIVAYKTPNNGWLVYTRNNFAALGGCAKPVVYLYPTHAEHVSVRVGATVTVSNPLYNPATGWNVFAQPSGALTVDGKTYGSLFWEGQGSGLYPGITAGTVVRRADALGTIKKQLQQQGLHQNEIADFVTYWQPKIPSEPYVRLTWLNTAQMNQLAPLHSSPQPDTLIRVFLDMDGFDQPVQLPAQHLSAPVRHGFTVVEWGGLSGSRLQ